jgi:hypothetical protein
MMLQILQKKYLFILVEKVVVEERILRKQVVDLLH